MVDPWRGDVVVVTINFRLRPFGSLRGKELSGGLDSTGNEAMLELAALEWGREEIAAFGGDPDNVTVLDESGLREHRLLAGSTEQASASAAPGGALMSR